jgi:phosphoglycolate phosphatase
MMKTGLLFDLDGTLLDTLEDLLDATNYALRTHGFPEKSLEQLRKVVGNGAANQIRKSLPEGTDEEIVQQVLATYKPYYSVHSQIKTKPYEGIPEVIRQLTGKYPMAIVSNKPDNAVKDLSRLWFPGIYALGETADCPRKPAADMVYKAMAAIGVEKCIYIGDSEVDILTARNAGVPCLSVTWGFRDLDVLQQAGGDHFCSSVAEFVSTVEEMIHGK